MNNTIDRTMYAMAKHGGLKQLANTLKNDLKTVIRETNAYCECEQPDFEQNNDLYWYCINCEKEANPRDPEDDDRNDGEIL